MFLISVPEMFRASSLSFLYWSHVGRFESANLSAMVCPDRPAVRAVRQSSGVRAVLGVRQAASAASRRRPA
jgi:hypothetical protein